MNTTAMNQGTRYFNNPKVITWAVIIITVVWAVMQDSIATIAFFTVIVIFLLGFKQPLWAITAILIAQFTITSAMVGTPIIDISLRLLLMVVTIFILWTEISNKHISLGPNSRPLIIPTVILVSLIAVSDIANSTGFDLVFTDFRNAIVGLLFIILLPAIINTPGQLKTMSSVLLIVVTASGVIGTLQHFDLLGMRAATLEPGFMDRVGRVPGMNESELELSYILPIAIFLLIGLFLYKEGKSRNWKLLIPMIPIALAIYFTYTRSALMALAYSAVALAVFALTRFRYFLVLCVVLASLVFLVYSDNFSGFSMSGRSEEGQENSSVARAILFQAGLAIAIDNPILGIGGSQFLEVSPQYASRVDPSLIEFEDDRYWSYRTLGEDYPHNDYITIWSSYGTPALIVFLFIHFVILKNCLVAFRQSKNRFIKGFSIGLAAAMVGYVANEFFHNLLATIPLLWMIGGLSLVLVKLAHKEKQTRRSRSPKTDLQPGQA